jgi:hypothetical protein
MYSHWFFAINVPPPPPPLPCDRGARDLTWLICSRPHRKNKDGQPNRFSLSTLRLCAAGLRQQWEYSFRGNRRTAWYGATDAV